MYPCVVGGGWMVSGTTLQPHGVLLNNGYHHSAGFLNKIELYGNSAYEMGFVCPCMVC